MKPLLTIVIFSLSAILCCNCRAQEKTDEEEVFQKHHQVGVVLSHAHIFEGVDADGNKSSLSLPAWGIDYTYYFHPKWAVGLHTDSLLKNLK